MKYAVEARAFGNGRIVVKVRRAKDGEESGCTETRSCDVWIDIFETKESAREFVARNYKHA